MIVKVVVVAQGQNFVYQSTNMSPKQNYWSPFVQSCFPKFKRTYRTQGYDNVTETWLDAQTVTERLRKGDDKFVTFCIGSTQTNKHVVMITNNDYYY